MEERILEQCIQSVDNKELIRKAISKGWELDKFIEEAAQIEGTNLQSILHGAYFSSEEKIFIKFVFSTQHIHLILLLFHFSNFCSI
jgi:hypothetical protein